MTKDNKWSQAISSIPTVYNCGKNYLYSFIMDYERYVSNFGYITTLSFLRGWTCLSPEEFKSLNVTDICYTYQGEKVSVVEEPTIYDEDDEVMYVEVAKVNKEGQVCGTTYMLDCGELYSHRVIHMDYLYNKDFRPKGEHLCPILITKTKQPQN